MPPQFQNNFQLANNPAQQEPPRKHTRLILLTVAMILVGVLAVGYFLYQSRQAPAPIESQNLTVASSANKFADWKTYRNDEYGFEFKYPSWLYQTSDPASNGIQVFFVEKTTLDRYPAGFDFGKAADAKFEILMDNGGAFLSESRFNEYFKAADNTIIKKYGDLKIRNYKIGGYDAVEFGYDEQSKAKELEANTNAIRQGASVGMVYFPRGLMINKNGVIIEISTSIYEGNFKKNFDQILSVFKFLE